MTTQEWGKGRGKLSIQALFIAEDTEHQKILTCVNQGLFCYADSLLPLLSILTQDQSDLITHTETFITMPCLITSHSPNFSSPLSSGIKPPFHPHLQPSPYILHKTEPFAVLSTQVTKDRWKEERQDKKSAKNLYHKAEEWVWEKNC